MCLDITITFAQHMHLMAHIKYFVAPVKLKDIYLKVRLVWHCVHQSLITMWGVENCHDTCEVIRPHFN